MFSFCFVYLCLSLCLNTCFSSCLFHHIDHSSILYVCVLCVCCVCVCVCVCVFMCRAKGRVLRGLTRRRQAEAKLWATPGGTCYDGSAGSSTQGGGGDDPPAAGAADSECTSIISTRK
jgi:hypothetical protein